MSADVESASDYTGVDEGKTLTIRRPKPENIREVYLDGETFRADLLSPTFFPSGLGFVREMEQLDFVKPIVLGVKQIGRRRHYTISPICFHAIRKGPNPDHYLCKRCAYALDARMCVKAGGCPTRISNKGICSHGDDRQHKRSTKSTSTQPLHGKHPLVSVLHIPVESNSCQIASSEVPKQRTASYSSPGSQQTRISPKQ